MKKINVLFGRGKIALAKESKPQDYKSLFMHEAEITARSGKTAYISKEHHERITKITQVIGKNEMSLFSYIHNVLEHHFATYKDDITDLYEKNIEQIFQAMGRIFIIAIVLYLIFLVGYLVWEWSVKRKRNTAKKLAFNPFKSSPKEDIIGKSGFDLRHSLPQATTLIKSEKPEENAPIFANENTSKKTQNTPQRSLHPNWIRSFLPRKRMIPARLI